MTHNTIRRVLISVYDKTNLAKFANFLVSRDVHILSTGGTFSAIHNAIPTSRQKQIEEISSYTGFKECFNGRVKTLHPKVHGALLAMRSEDHENELVKLGLKRIDMVVTNLYPFSQVRDKITSKNDEDLLLENIDIGGHTLIRSSAKNYQNVLVVTDVNDYEPIMARMKKNKFDMAFRRNLAQKAWHHITAYDMAISGYFNPQLVYRSYSPVKTLKYGTNPQQGHAGWYYNNASVRTMPFKCLHGNPGYINVLDAIYSWNLVCEISRNVDGLVCAASFKHNSPAGVALANRTLTKIEKQLAFMDNTNNDNVTYSAAAIAFVRARYVDPMSSYGDFIAISDIVDVTAAQLIKREVSDGIVAKGYTEDALAILKQKKKGNYIILKGFVRPKEEIDKEIEVREMHGVTLVQQANLKETSMDNAFHTIPTLSKKIPGLSKVDLILANTTLKYTQSNSVCAAYDGQVIAIGAGQQSRIDCVKLVKQKIVMFALRQHPVLLLELKDWNNTSMSRSAKINTMVDYIEKHLIPSTYSLAALIPPEIALASDAFFPFRDSIDVAAEFGTRYIIQPGGSIADAKVIKACNEHGITMATTGRDMRMFLH